MINRMSDSGEGHGIRWSRTLPPAWPGSVVDSEAHLALLEWDAAATQWGKGGLFGLKGWSYCVLRSESQEISAKELAVAAQSGAGYWG